MAGEFCYAACVPLLKIMRPSESASVFRDRVTRSGLSVEDLTPAEAVAQMLAFYREVRAENCVADEEGDMLLFQWGTYDWGDGKTFQVEFTRQFIEPGDEDEEGMSQLSLTLRYSPTDALHELGSGDHWCESPAEAEAFQEFVLANEAYRAVVVLKPGKATLDWTPV